MKNAPVSVESSAATAAGGAPLRFRRPRFARATLFAAAASVVVAATGGIPGFAPLASGAVESDFSKTESISISFGGQELTIGSPGAVPVAHENWNVPGALANGTIANLKGGSGSLTGVGVEWKSGGIHHSSADVNTANGQLTWGYLDDPGITNFWGMSDIGPSVMLSNLGSLPASTFDVYVILASDSMPSPASGRPVYVNGTWYKGGTNSTVQGTEETSSNWSRASFENGGVMTEGIGGSYLKVSVLPDGASTIKIASGKNNAARGSLAAVQVVYDITSSFLNWSAGNSTWDASSDSFQDSFGTSTSWGTSTGGQVAVFNGNDAPTLSGTHSASGLWVKSGDVVLNGDGAVNLVYAAKVVVENGASLTVGSAVDLNFTNSSGSLVLEGANSHFHANKSIALPSVSGLGTYHVNNSMTVLTGELSTANFAFTNGGVLAINPAKVATPFTLSGNLTGSTGQVVAQGGILRVTSPGIGAPNSISFSVQSGASIGFGPGAQINSLTLADGSIYSLLGDSLPYSSAQISTLNFGGTGAVKISFSELPLTAFTAGTPFTVFGYSGSALTPEVLSALTTDTARVSGTFAYSSGSLTFTPFTVGFYQREWTAAGDGNWTGANYEYTNWNSTLITDPNANGDRIYLPATSTRRTITIDAGKTIHLDSTKTGWTWGVGTGLADNYAGGLTRLGNGQWVIEGGTLDTGTAVQGAYAILAAGSGEGDNRWGIRTDAGLVIRSKITGSGSIATVHNGSETIKLYIAGDASEYTGTIHLAQNNRDMALIDNGVLGDGATVTGAGSLKIFTSTTLGATVNANIQIGSQEGYNTVPTNSIVRLTGENNISSSIYVYSGTLAVTKDANLGSNSLTIGANTSGLNAGATPTLQFLADGATFSKAFAVEHSNSSIKVGTALTDDTGTPISVTYNGQISGGGGLTKTGAGKLTLTGSGYSYTGGTNVNAGTLSIGADANIGSGTHTINNDATLEISGNITKPWVIGASGGTISTTGAAGDVRTFAMLSGSGKLTKAGASTLALTGTPDFTGPVSISAGALKLGNGGTTGILAGTSPITLSGGGSLVLDLADQPGVTQTFSRAIDGTGTFSKNNTAAIAFTGTTASNVTLAVNSGTLLTSGAIGGSVDVVSGAVFGATGGSIANLTLQGGSIYRATDGFAVPVTNLAAPSGTVYFDIGGIFSPSMALGLYPLLGFSNLSGSANFEILDANAYRGSFSILKNANDITLDVNSVGGSYSLRWTGDVDSNWAFSTQNWRIISGGTVDAPSDFVANDSVLFDSTAPANRRTVTLAAGAQFKPAAMTVDTANGANYIFDGAGSIAGDELAVVLKGGGTVTINTENRYGVLSGGTRIETGTTVNIGHVNALGSGTVTVLGNTTINANAGPFANAIQLANGSFTLNFPGRETSELVIGNALSGVGNLTVSGSARRTFTNPTGFTGTLHLSAPVTFSGANADWSGVALVTSSVSGDHNFTGTGTTRLK
ncbi:MAG: autotransporter-associated beta strand repeat-containing protein, partial [Puniceicoccales bacterium]|nr:autotransporter-associated beta strand repeat-containing protein [Puniceicoccales bacterium]